MSITKSYLYAQGWTRERIADACETLDTAAAVADWEREQERQRAAGEQGLRIVDANGNEIVLV